MFKNEEIFLIFYIIFSLILVYFLYIGFPDEVKTNQWTSRIFDDDDEL